MAAINVTQVTGLAGTPASTTYTPVGGIRSSVLDTTNLAYARNITMDSIGIMVARNGVTPSFFLPISALLALAVSTVPGLTWIPFFTAQPVNRSSGYGLSADFGVTVNSELAVTYQWQGTPNANVPFSNLANSGIYSGVTTSAIHISNVNGLSGWAYRVVVTNAKGSSTSNPAFLTVVDPQIVAGVGPNNVTVAHPNPALFSTAAVGTPTLTYQWQQNLLGAGWVNLSNGTDAFGVTYSGVTTNSLSLSNTATTITNSQYRCVVTNGALPTAGTVISGSALLIVN
jgi:hypothetical protein